jgi:hypothetical protein
MLPFYLQNGYQQSVTRASEELKAQMPGFARIQAEAQELELKQQREEEIHRCEAFSKRAEEIGYVNALVEDSTNVDTAIAEAKMALKGAIVYKK